MDTLTCNGRCENMTATCPNVEPYPLGSPRKLHTEVRCNGCNDRWCWGLSWDGSKDGQFWCDNCKEDIREEAIDNEIEHERLLDEQV